MKYISTRNKVECVSSSTAIINGLSNNGGLYVPTHFENIKESLPTLLNFSYRELTSYILSKYLTDYDIDTLNKCIGKAYDSKFDCENQVVIKKVSNSYFLELFHGPTLAFKDMALTLMPHLLSSALKINNIDDKNVTILTATSGDTGKAALEGYKNIEKINIIVFFPESGVSEIQKLQMRTQEGNNTHIIGINGNFDDAQNGVKEIFSNNDFNNLLSNKDILLSSANSINIGRLLPQIVYYFYTYLSLVKNNEISMYDSINFVVPTGNFGNILAGYYAKLMGLPINKLICASNDNNVLYDFFNSHIYNKNRELKLTTSPSMDILVSSNLERLLFELCNRDTDKINKLMINLNEFGLYKLSDDIINNLNDFYAEYSTEQDIANTIKELFNEYKYLIDTHTAVAYNCYKKYVNATNDSTKSVIVSTASPYKFSKDVLNSIDSTVNIEDNFLLMNYLSDISMTDVPKNLEDLKSKEILHKSTCHKNQMLDEIKKILKV